MAKNGKDRYLKKRHGRYWFKRRIAGTNKTKEFSLKTDNLNEARKLRDEYVRIMNEQSTKVEVAKNTLEIRERYLNTLDENEKEYIEEQVKDQADDLAYSLGIYEQLNDHTPVEELSPDAIKVKDYYEEALGRLHVLEKWLPEWLETIKDRQTRLDYGRGVKALLKHHPIAEDLTREKVTKFYKTIGTLENVHKASVEKWKSGHLSLWKYLGLDDDLFRNQKIPETTTKDKKPELEEWSKREARMLYETATERNHWLKHPIWIAIHTGARQEAIANLKYHRLDQTITFPRAKKEKKDRTIPAHSSILPSLEAWIQNRKASTTISNQFTSAETIFGLWGRKKFPWAEAHPYN